MSQAPSAARPVPVPGDFPVVSREKLRYGDTDRQGHVNNAVYATFLETGRVETLMGGADLKGPDGAFVLAHLELDFIQEVNWPGEVLIGTRVASVGRSSVRMEQAVFQNDVFVARGMSVVVLTDKTTRRSKPFSDEARGALETLIAKAPIDLQA
jgi:acyl-CoA thioester hydrolase